MLTRSRKSFTFQVWKLREVIGLLGNAEICLVPIGKRKAGKEAKW
jgi:hypothetical protein